MDPVLFRKVRISRFFIYLLFKNYSIKLSNFYLVHSSVYEIIK